MPGCTADPRERSLHLAEGILSPEVLAAGAIATAAGTTIGLYKLESDDVPKAAMMSAAFFVASLIHVPLGPASAHLVLNGLMGLVLGWAAFPAILTALVLQMVFFGHGGLTTLGVNTFAMAAPAIACYVIFHAPMRDAGRRAALVIGLLSGAFAIVGSGLLNALALVSSGDEFRAAAGAILAAHLPIVFIEAFVTSSVVAFLVKVRPEALHAFELTPATSDERSFA